MRGLVMRVRVGGILCCRVRVAELMLKGLTLWGWGRVVREDGRGREMRGRERGRGRRNVPYKSSCPKMLGFPTVCVKADWRFAFVLFWYGGNKDDLLIV